MTACRHMGNCCNTRSPIRREARSQPDAREGQAGPDRVADRLVVPGKPGNSGGGKGPEFKKAARRGKGQGEWCKPRNLPTNVQDPKAATHLAQSNGWAKCFLVREPDAGNPPVRFDERGVETEPRSPRHSSTLLPPDTRCQPILPSLPNYCPHALVGSRWAHLLAGLAAPRPPGAPLLPLAVVMSAELPGGGVKVGWEGGAGMVALPPQPMSVAERNSPARGIIRERMSR